MNKMPIKPEDLNSTKVDMTHNIELPDEVQVRFSQLAKDFQDTRVQAYVEANFGNQALEIVKMVLGKFL